MAREVTRYFRTMARKTRETFVHPAARSAHTPQHPSQKEDTLAEKTGSETLRNILGEIIGTFMMCFFGIGAVANATLGVSGAFGGPFQVGMVWGITIAIAIYATRNLSCAHFNPAVTTAMCATGPSI